MDGINIVNVMNDLITHYGTTYNYTCTDNISQDDTTIVLDSAVFQCDGSLVGHPVSITIIDNVTTEEEDDEGNTVTTTEQVPQVVFSGTIQEHVSGTEFTLSGTINIEKNDDDCDGSDSCQLNRTATIVEIGLNPNVLSLCNSCIDQMNSANAGIMTEYYFPTTHDTFTKYADWAEEMISYADSWKDPDFLNNKMSDWIVKMEAPNTPCDLIGEANISAYIINITSMKDEALQMQTDIKAYFARLKKNIVMWKVEAKMTSGQPSDGIYGSLSSESKAKVDDLLDYNAAHTAEEYNEYKQQLMLDLKID